MYKRRHQIGLPFYLPGAVIAAVPAWLLTNWFHDTKAGTALGPFREFDREILRQLTEKKEKEYSPARRAAVLV